MLQSLSWSIVDSADSVKEDFYTLPQGPQPRMRAS